MEKAEEEAGERKGTRGEGGGSCSCVIHDVVGEYLLTEILIWLPVDQIFRCKSVCKYWRSLVENPLFAAEYRKKKKKKGKKQSKEKEEISCILEAHPQQRSPILIPVNEDYDDNGESKKPKFSLDFVPDFAQLHGYTKYSDLRQLEVVHGKKVKYSWRWGVPNYYTVREMILGSSNGLLLCAPLLRTPKQPFGVEHTFDGFAQIYVVCNPHTKQWLRVPPPFTSTIFSHEVAHVGFVSDFDSSGVCWFKIVRLPLNFDSEGRRSLDLQVFSSESWEWTTLKVPSLPQPIGPDEKMQKVAVAVTLKKNGDDCSPRLCWMFKGSQAMVYDPINNVVDAVIEAIRPSNSGTVQKVDLDGMCIINGQLWAGKFFDVGMKLKIYRASGNEWEMVKEFDMRSVQNNSRIQNQFIASLSRNKFVTMNPDDPEQVYLRICSSFALLDMRSRTLKVVGGLRNIREPLAIVCDNPLWPTPLPSPFPSSSS